MVHHVSRLAHCKSADSVAVKVKLAYLLHMLDSQVVISTALVDAKKHLVLVYRAVEGVEPLHFRHTAFEPACRSLAGGFGVVVLRRVFNALVKSHCDSRSKVRLNLHTFLRSHKNLSAVNVGVEENALFLYPAQFGEAENLKSAAVCEYRLVPVHELMQTAQLVDDFVAGANVQMICVAKLDLCFKLGFKVDRGNAALYRRACANVHKHRGLYRSVNGLELAAPCSALLFE